MADRPLSIVVELLGSDKLSGILRNVTGVGGAANEKLKNLNKTLDKNRTELKKVKSAMADAWRVPGAAQSLLRYQKNLEDRINRVTAAAKKQRDAINFQGAADRWGEKSRSAGYQNIQTGAGMAAPLVLAVKAGAEFETIMTDISQKADLSDEKTRLMSVQIREAAKAAGQMNDDMARGVDSLMGSGLDENTSMKLIAPIGKVASAYGAEMADVSEMVYANYSNLQVPLEDTTKALEAMAYASKAGKFEMKDMALYMPSLAAQAAAFGQKGVKATADIAAAAQIVRGKTGTTETAAANLEDLYAKINMEDTRKKFAKAGIDLKAEMNKALASGKSPIEAIAELTKKATKGNLSEISMFFGDKNAQGAVRALIMDLEKYKQIRKDALNSSGVLDTDFAKRSDDAASQFKNLMRAVSNLGIVIGTRLLPIINPLIEKTASVIDNMGAWAQKHPTLTGGMLKFAGILIGANLALGGMRLAFGFIIGPAARMINVVKGIWSVGRMLLPVLAGLSWPVWALIGGITALTVVGVYLWNKWKKSGLSFGEFIKKMPGMILQDLSKWISAGWQMAQGLINGLLGRKNDVKAAAAETAHAATQSANNTLKVKSPSRVFMGIGGFVSQGLAIGIKNRAGLATNAAKNMARGVALAGAITSVAVGSPAMATARPPLPQSRPTQNVTININANGLNAAEIAAAVKRELQKINVAAKVKSNADYEDKD